MVSTRSPRRLPWASQSELQELHDLLFIHGSEVTIRQRALSRMSIYISSPSCPAFIPLLHGLLAADVLPDPPRSSEEAQNTRLSCAMAIVRFVNGMVDPLQTGPYARPILHIAASLGIPPSLISLRHRATHEDLPPLPLLRQAIHQAINYLHHYALLPMLSSSSTTPLPRSGRAEGLIKRWKGVMKHRLKERLVGDENDSGKEMKGLRKMLGEEEVGDVAAALCGVEGLIPVGRKKRTPSSSDTPTSSSLQIWTPLIEHLTCVDPSFVVILAQQIVSTLLAAVRRPEAGELSEEGSSTLDERTHISFRWNLAVWLVWLFENGLIPQVEKTTMWREILGAVVNGDTVLIKLYNTLVERDPSLVKRKLDLGGLISTSDMDEEQLLGGLDIEMDEKAGEDVSGREDELDAMERRLKELESRMIQKPKVQSSCNSDDRATNVGGYIPGWRRLGEGEWKACPIGVWGIA